MDQFGLMKMQKQLIQIEIHDRMLVSYRQRQYAAGCLIEPPVSEPKLNGTKPAATAAADPPDEPPGTALWSNGLTVFLK